MNLEKLLFDRWTSLTTPYVASDTQAAQFRAQQLHTCLRLTPWVVVSNILNCALVVWLFNRHLLAPVHWVWGVAWAVVTVVAASSGLRPWWLLRKGQLRNTASVKTLGKATRNAAVLAGLWGTVYAVAYPDMDILGQKAIIALAVGMICAGSFIFAPLPRAAVAYVIVMALGGLVGLARLGLTSESVILIILLLLFSGFMIAIVFYMARNLGVRLEAQAEAVRQAELVGLLLNDFESSSSDWLWELNAEGALEHVSVRMAQVLRQPKEALLGASFYQLLATHLRSESPTAQEHTALAVLETALSTTRAFRKIDIPVFLGGQQHWWSLTGKPLLDADGQLMGWRGVGTDITRSRNDTAAMHQLANFDVLTGLANRRYFQNCLADIRTRPCTLLLMDLDSFKAANDTHGHSTGDRVLQIVANRFKAQIRQGDVLARLGGDEFALIAWGSSADMAMADLATRLIESLREPMAIDHVRVKVGTSVGIAKSQDSTADVDELLKFADMALYAAKEAGRNTHVFFSQEMNELAQKRMKMVEELREAIERQQFVLLYQPQVNIKTGRLTCAEALIRWLHPLRGMVSPGEFVPLAEQTNLILSIGAWALGEACREAARWTNTMRVAVNVSAVQFCAPDFVQSVVRSLDDSGLAPHRLELEITESLLIEDRHAVRTILQSLREVGVRVALDDFGTGYSSLAYLRSFPLDKLKIDGAFVRRLSEDEQATAIVRTIIDLAQALHLDVTAECIETLDQYEALRALDCSDAQGYWVSRPVPSGELLAFVDQWPQSHSSVNSRL